MLSLLWSVRKRGQFPTPMAVISIAIYREDQIKEALRTFMERPRQTITGMWNGGQKNDDTFETQLAS